MPLNNETGNITFTRNNFGLIALEINTASEKQQTFNFAQTSHANESITSEQLSVTSEPISGVSGSLSPQGLDSCSSGIDSRRIAYSVFQSPGLFLTPETVCEEFAIGSVILGVRVTNSSVCNTPVIVNLRQLAEVKNRWITHRLFMILIL